MSNPDWFVLIQQWRQKGMGVYGVTLPFIVGALAYKLGETTCQAAQVRELLDQIIYRPVDGYVTEVRWCGDIDAPVFSVSSIKSSYNRISVKSSFPHPSGSGISLGFSQDLQSSLGGLDCKDAPDCYEKLVAYAEEHVKKGNFSRNRSDKTNKFEYGPFQEHDLKFIRETIMK